MNVPFVCILLVLVPVSPARAQSTTPDHELEGTSCADLLECDLAIRSWYRVGASIRHMAAGSTANETVDAPLWSRVPGVAVTTHPVMARRFLPWMLVASDDEWRSRQRRYVRMTNDDVQAWRSFLENADEGVLLSIGRHRKKE